MRTFRPALFVLLGLTLLPAAAFAQASIAGIVKDSSGAVLPGVTVEASSPVLIEKVRSAVTDAGGRGNEGRLQLDGISVGSAFNGAGVSAYIADVGNAQEITMTTSGGLGEAEVGGPSLNVVPKTGGNTLKGSFYLSGVTKGMIGSNYTD